MNALKHRPKAEPTPLPRTKVESRPVNKFREGVMEATGALIMIGGLAVASAVSILGASFATHEFQQTDTTAGKVLWALAGIASVGAAMGINTGTLIGGEKIFNS